MDFTLLEHYLMLIQGQCTMQRHVSKLFFTTGNKRKIHDEIPAFQIEDEEKFIA